MEKLTDIFEKNVFQQTSDYKTAQPGPMGVFDDFLPKDVALSLYNEMLTIPDEHWRIFSRNGSHMMELNKLNLAPQAFNLVNYLHSSQMLKQLSDLTGIPDLIPDPHLVGAGYSKSFPGDTLKLHTDFNWNDTLKLHRACSLIIYLTPDWQSEWNGGLDFYDQKRQAPVTHVDCLFNRCLIWNYHKYGWHGHLNPLSNPQDKPRTTFRLFYYTSNSTYKQDDPPHRSQYWMDENGLPTDKRDHV